MDSSSKFLIDSYQAHFMADSSSHNRTRIFPVFRDTPQIPIVYNILAVANKNPALFTTSVFPVVFVWWAVTQ